MNRILIIDDDEDFCISLKFSLKQEGFEVEYASTGASGLQKVDVVHPDLILLDLNLPDQSGLEVLKKLNPSESDWLLAMITGEQDSRATIEAMKHGAFDYIRKPFDLDEMQALIAKAGRFRSTNKARGKDPVEIPDSTDNLRIVGNSREMLEIVKQIGLLARSGVSVLIEGESGTGKELVARSIHEATSQGKPLVAMNCSSLVGTLMESELFGHEKGAFTGALQRKIGKLEYAGTGTVFLDEIGDMPLELQAKILRVLQERQFERVGGLESLPFKARVIAATNRQLDSMVRSGQFREDLFYRLAVTRLVIPPLRERKQDIPYLVDYLIHKISRNLHRRVERIDEKAVRRLIDYDWPGNVRELENVLTRAIALAKGSTIMAEDMEITFESRNNELPELDNIPNLEQVEKEHILKTLLATGWNISKTSRILEIAPNTLRSKIDKYDLSERTEL